MRIFRRVWWKVLCIVLIGYTILAGFLSSAPQLPILHESIRNLYFHVPMWFAMTLLLLASAAYSIRYLSQSRLQHDFYAASFAAVALLFGTVGLLTGMQWAKTTWGDWWVNDPKLMGAAVGLLLYLAYFILRGSMDDIDKRAKISAVANVMFFAIFIPAIFIVPRLTDSLHPGNGGNPGFDVYDLDGGMRLVFYPAIIGWSLLAFWLASLKFRLKMIEWQLKVKSESMPHVQEKNILDQSV